MNVFRPTIVRLLLVVPLLAAGIALGAPSPAAATTVCDTGPLGVRSDVTKDNVVVLAGTSCNLVGAMVRGGVTVEPGGRLLASEGTEIRGSITATAPSRFVVDSAVVRGNVTVAGGTDVVTLFIAGSQVRGDIVVTGVTTFTGGAITVNQNTVRGSVILRDNTATGAGFSVAGSVIDINLDCSGNTPDPSLGVGSPNTVGGAKLGECASL